MEAQSMQLKKRHFRLATTSFIYPDHIIPNVRKIGGFFDEIELLVFESRPEEVLPAKADVQELLVLSKDLDLTYNVHLPYDVSLTDPVDRNRQQAADTLAKTVELFEPLSPTTFTLHLPMDREGTDAARISAWKEHAWQGLDLLVPRLPDPGKISVETLWYGPACLRSLVREFGLSLCLDAGHFFKYGHDLAGFWQEFKGYSVPLIHLHGVDFSGASPCDHQGLDRLSDYLFDQIVSSLARYEGTLSLEVFNLENLVNSLKRLAQVFQDIPAPWDL